MPDRVPEARARNRHPDRAGWARTLSVFLNDIKNIQINDKNITIDRFWMFLFMYFNVFCVVKKCTASSQIAWDATTCSTKSQPFDKKPDQKYYFWIFLIEMLWERYDRISGSSQYFLSSSSISSLALVSASSNRIRHVLNSEPLLTNINASWKLPGFLLFFVSD